MNHIADRMGESVAGALGILRAALSTHHTEDHEEREGEEPMNKLREDLKAAGWTEAILGDCQVGDEVIFLAGMEIHGTITEIDDQTVYFSHVSCDKNHPVLHAPRPEPVFERGEVWWCRHNETGKEGNLIYLGENWLGLLPGFAQEVWPEDEVTPLRKLLNADGTVPIARSLRERLLDEGTVEAVARDAWEHPIRGSWKNRAEDVEAIERKVAQLYLATAANVLAPEGEQA